MSTQRSDIENVNCNSNNVSESDKDNQVEKEWPACKKRKLNSKDGNIHDISTSNKNILVDKQSTGKNIFIFLIISNLCIQFKYSKSNQF